MRKGIFIPEITVEMFRNATLEAVEELLVSGTMEDIEIPDRPHGEWKEFTVSTYRGTDEWGEPKWGKGKKFICKRCGRRTVIRENFCPNCGADMRQKEGDEE